MSIQTTKYITREEAERRLSDRKAEEARELWTKLAKTFTNNELEEAIEETFNNYEIVEENK